MRSITSGPRPPSRRNPLAVIDPSGNASAAATERRSGRSGLTSSGGGPLMTESLRLDPWPGQVPDEARQWGLPLKLRTAAVAGFVSRRAPWVGATQLHRGKRKVRKFLTYWYRYCFWTPRLLQ